MGKITDALRKAAQERLSRIEKLDKGEEVKYQFIAKKTVDSKFDPRIVTFYEPKSTVSEQYRTLRTNLQSQNPKNPVRAITITSSTHSEGKTITAINLAISMAKDLNKKQILLVDADLRRASMSKYLGVKAELGLADLISNGTNMDDTLLNLGIDNLTFLPAGKSSHNPAELFASDKLPKLISQLRSKYDYLIFDTPPIIPVTDAGLLGAQTDGVIMVIQAERTQKGVVKHSEGLLKQAQARLLGYILTNIQYHIPGYIYRYL
ncbi:MAG: CpsD/CapB family tyrosine-protein kinase [Candidatus Omnitrophica bacterium]|nr:CpsD/CapB family tyrosine-protein kinase [Candidatus Omnitrophota bacterium]